MITQRDVILEGILADGSPIVLEPNSGFGRGGSFLPIQTDILVTLVPEPGTLGLISVGALCVLRRSRAG